jgi:NAD(P)-dependent dehydrogenase (short-subunit alcohol dehydrogenase family)
VTGLDGLGYRETTAVVVGCSSGIGAATLQLLGDLGARVHAVSVNEPDAPHASFHACDLARLDSIAAAVDAVRSVGPIDHLFVASGIPVTRDSLDILRVNYVGVRHITEQLVPLLRDGAGAAVVSSSAGGGWEQELPGLLEIVGIADPDEAMAWFSANPDRVADGYRLSKQLLNAWVAHAAPALGLERRIRLNATAPGVTETALIEETRAYVPEGFFERYTHPLHGRGATAEEQAWSFVLLNSPLNSCVTGSVLWCDQGVGWGTRTGALPQHH